MRYSIALAVRRRHTIISLSFLLSNCNINKNKEKSRGNLLELKIIDQKLANAQNIIIINYVKNIQ